MWTLAHFAGGGSRKAPDEAVLPAGARALDGGLRPGAEGSGRSVCDELLAAVDVVRGTSEGAVGHDMQCESGDIRRSDHPANG